VTSQRRRRRPKPLRFSRSRWRLAGRFSFCASRDASPSALPRNTFSRSSRSTALREASRRAPCAGARWFYSTPRQGEKISFREKDWRYRMILVHVHASRSEDYRSDPNPRPVHRHHPRSNHDQIRHQRRNTTLRAKVRRPRRHGHFEKRIGLGGSLPCGIGHTSASGTQRLTRGYTAAAVGARGGKRRSTAFMLPQLPISAQRAKARRRDHRSLQQEGFEREEIVVCSKGRISDADEPMPADPRQYCFRESFTRFLPAKISAPAANADANS